MQSAIESQLDWKAHSLQIQQLCKQRQFVQAEKIADLYFRNNLIAEAIIAYQLILQANPEEDYRIDGLGNSEEQSGYYQYTVAEWYHNEKAQHNIKGSPYDALSLCYSKNKEDKKGKQWFEKMLLKYPNNYQLHFGYANILFNSSIYEQAVRQYSKVIELKPHFVKPYIDIAFVYEYHRIEKQKSMQWAHKALQINSKNEYALFILARNEKQIQTKIDRLKQISSMYPKNTRIANQIGIAYGAGLKDYGEAIVWYTKCIERTPKYFSAYNNIGVNYEIKKNYDEAKIWYFKAIEQSYDYKAPHTNLIDVFDVLHTSDEDILQQSYKYNIKKDWFCFELGLAFYDKNQPNKSITWYLRAIELNNKEHKFFNSLAIAYDEIKQIDLAIANYKKCIEMSPDFYSAYYNLAIAYKNKEDIDSAIHWYLKCVEVNPRHSYSYNNLGNIYKNRGDYLSAIKYYKLAVEHLSTYTLAFTNLGVCYLNISNYREAFKSFSRANEILSSDNNNLSKLNRQFLEPHLAKFKEEGQKWSKTGEISVEDKQMLRGLVREFQGKLHMPLSSAVQLKLPKEKVLQAEVIRINDILFKDKFELVHFHQIFELVLSLFKQDKQYFNIVPQIFIEYFWKHRFELGMNFKDIENELKDIIASISQKYAKDQSSVLKQELLKELHGLDQKYTPKPHLVNLFQETTYFNNYESLYSEIYKVNQHLKTSLDPFQDFVKSVSAHSNGSVVGVGMKIPEQKQEQLRVILILFEQIFKMEFDDAKMDEISSKIEQNFAQIQNLTLSTLIHEIMQVITAEITLILQGRFEKKIQTEFKIPDLINGRITFEKPMDLIKAINTIEQLSKAHDYLILAVQKRLFKDADLNIVITIRIKNAVCELQLGMKELQTSHHVIQNLKEIEQSTFGCIFGSYLFLSKPFKYSYIANCKDIVEELKDSPNEADKTVFERASYIIEILSQKSKP